MQVDLEVDALGLLCPLPVLKARRRLMGLAQGQILSLLADDPAAIVDVPHFCREAGHDLISAETAAGCGERARRYLIRKG